MNHHFERWWSQEDPRTETRVEGIVQNCVAGEHQAPARRRHCAHLQRAIQWSFDVRGAKAGQQPAETAESAAMHKSDVNRQTERTSEPDKPEAANGEARSEFGQRIRQIGGHQPVPDLEQQQWPFFSNQQRRPNERRHSAEAVKQLAINKRFREFIHQQTSAGEPCSEDRSAILGSVVFGESNGRANLKFSFDQLTNQQHRQFDRVELSLNSTLKLRFSMPRRSKWAILV